MKVSREAVKALREKTGAPVGDVKSALEAAGGDETKARAVLKQKGFEAAQKRRGRASAVGRVDSYVHHDGRIGVLIEVNCETDFVARLTEFKQFCRDVAMQVASQNPRVLRKEDLSGQQLDEAKQLGKSPEEFVREVCLLEQPCIKDQGQTVGESLTSLVAKTGEDIVVRRFARFELGES